MLKFIREDGTEVPVRPGMKKVLTVIILLVLAIATLASVGVGALLAHL